MSKLFVTYVKFLASTRMILCHTCRSWRRSGRNEPDEKAFKWSPSRPVVFIIVVDRCRGNFSQRIWPLDRPSRRSRLYQRSCQRFAPPFTTVLPRRHTKTHQHRRIFNYLPSHSERFHILYWPMSVRLPLRYSSLRTVRHEYKYILKLISAYFMIYELCCLQIILF